MKLGIPPTADKDVEKDAQTAEAMAKYTGNTSKEEELDKYMEPGKVKEKVARNKRKVVRALTGPFRNMGRCVDFALRMVGLRKYIKPRLREVTVRNSDEDGKQLHLNVIWPCEIYVLKKKIQALCSIRSDNQRLVYMGKILRDDEMIPEECFLKEDKAAQKRHDGTEEMIFHIWLVNVGFSLDKYQLMREKQSKIHFGVTSSAKITPDDGIGETEEDKKEREEEERVTWEVNQCLKSLITKVEQKVIDEQLDGEDPVLHAKKDRFNIEKELELIGCSLYAEGLKKIGFGERGAFSFLREEHLTGYPLFVHGKAKRKIVGLASAYRRQLQYEEQQHKTHLTKMNEVSFSKKYTVDGKEFFHSKAEMDAFYENIESEKKEAARRESKAHIRNKFMKVRKGFGFLAMTQQEPKAKEHNEIVEEKIQRISVQNERDEWELPSRPAIYTGYMQEKYKNIREQELKRLKSTKTNQWGGDIRERMRNADAFKCGHVPISDLRRILTRIFEKENVHNAAEKVEVVLSKSGNNIHHDEDKIVKYSLEVMIDALEKHISGEQLKAQKHRLEEEAEKKRKQRYWLYKEEDDEMARKKELAKLTPYNCPGFEPQPFNGRVCKHCMYDRALHTMIHTKEDYQAIIAKKNMDAMNSNMAIQEANEILARQEEVKKKLREQMNALGGVQQNWEDTKS